jgi:hypothetical protein
MKFSEDNQAKHFYTSAKTGEGLDEIFLYITEQIAKVSQASSSNSDKPNKGNKKLQISKGNTDSTNKGGCCK